MSDDRKYPDSKKRGLFGKRQRDEEAIKCVYAGPDYFAARTGRVYAGPERDRDDDRDGGRDGGRDGENDAGIEEVYAGPEFFGEPEEVADEAADEATTKATGEVTEEDGGSTEDAANEAPEAAEEEKSESEATGSEKAKDADPRPAGPDLPPQTFMAVYAGPAYFNGEKDRLGFMSVGGFAPAPFKISEFCPDCGSGAREGDRFCRSCGRKLGK
ncbi:MAG: hypothetical protein K5647_06405 [Clostridiales bacterium]|nr:hypothetical protein [Clostridiales bacterium]